MPEWLILVIVFAVVFGCGEGCRRGISAYRGGGSDADDPDALSGRAGAGGHRLSADTHGVDLGSGLETAGVERRAEPAAASATTTAREETTLEALQRRFVEGELSLEQYEAKLDELDRSELG